MKKLLLTTLSLVVAISSFAIVPPGGPQIMQRKGNTLVVDREELWFQFNFSSADIAEAWNMGVWLGKDYVVYEDEDIKVTAAVDQTPVYYKGNKNDQIKQEDGVNGYFNMGSLMMDQTVSGEETITDFDFDSWMKNEYMGILCVTPKVDGTLGAKMYAGNNKRCFGIFKVPLEDEFDEDYFGEWVAYVNFRNGDPAKDENLECSYHHTTHEENAPEYITGEVVANREYLIIAGGQKNMNLSLLTFDSPYSAINNTIVDNNKVSASYNLAGQKVSNDYKGIVVKNGKKMIVK